MNVDRLSSKMSLRAYVQYMYEKKGICDILPSLNLQTAGVCRRRTPRPTAQFRRAREHYKRIENTDLGSFFSSAQTSSSPSSDEELVELLLLSVSTAAPSEPELAANGATTFGATIVGTSMGFRLPPHPALHHYLQLSHQQQVRVRGLDISSGSRLLKHQTLWSRNIHEVHPGVDINVLRPI